MALNEIIAQGAQFKAPDLMGQYNNALAIQNGMQTNQMNQFKMDEARRAIDEQNKLRSVYAGITDYNDPSILNKIGAVSPKAAMDMGEFQRKNSETGAKVRKENTDAISVALKNSKDGLTRVRTPQEYLEWTAGNFADPVLGPWLKSRGGSLEQVLATVQDRLKVPGGFDAMLTASAVGADKMLENHFVNQDTGGTVSTLSMPKYGTGPATVVPGSVATKVVSPDTVMRDTTQRRGQDMAAQTAANTLAANKDKKSDAVLKVEAAKEEGLKALDDITLTLGQQYDLLDKNGGITSTQNKWGTNLAAAAESSGPGQFVGKVLGTENQSARNQIAMTRPHLLMAVKNATGMTARQLDSNADLKLWLQAATDPTLDIQANRAALENIRKFASAHAPSAAGTPKPPQQAPAGEVNQALEWARKNPNDPDAKRIIREFGGR